MSYREALIAALLAGDARMSENVEDRRGQRLKLKELQEIAAEINRGPRPQFNPAAASDPERLRQILDDLSRTSRKAWE